MSCASKKPTVPMPSSIRRPWRTPHRCPHRRNAPSSSELQIGKPSVITEGNQRPEMRTAGSPHHRRSPEFMGAVIGKLGTRKAEMVSSMTDISGYTRLEFIIHAAHHRLPQQDSSHRYQAMASCHVFHGYAPGKAKSRAARGSWLPLNRARRQAMASSTQDRGTMFVNRVKKSILARSSAKATATSTSASTRAEETLDQHPFLRIGRRLAPPHAAASGLGKIPGMDQRRRTRRSYAEEHPVSVNNPH